MPEEIITIVKIPLSEIAESIKEKHILPSRLTDVRIEGDNLVLSFAEENQPILPDPHSYQRKRRQRKRRNRMKTRGWAVVGRITNSKGQKCSIYKPFVDALQNSQLTVEDQRKKVEAILRANRNKPSEGSVRYFLENTIEYLQNQTNPANPENGGGIT